MESFAVENGRQKKAATTTFGMIRRGNASDLAKMKPHFFRVMLDFMLQDAKISLLSMLPFSISSMTCACVMLEYKNQERKLPPQIQISPSP
ncbi:unnamed protein product [Linum trigynum]|uniref:Uncharacterized protein n=1 Tax=Linum trigynum TaxID=586398 RepID=A0AAV2GH68_9ROSI